MGPTASTIDSSGEPFYGLYQITIYPFLAASFLPMVYHNDTYVNCYFDSGDLVGTAQADPGWLLANACADLSNAQSSRRGVSTTQVYKRDDTANRRSAVWTAAERPMGVVTVHDRTPITGMYEEGHSEFGLDVRGRRGVSGISWSDTKLQVAQQFKPPDTSILREWLATGPLLCLIVGVLLAIIHSLWNMLEARRDRRVHALIADMDAAADEKEKGAGEDNVCVGCQGTGCALCHGTHVCESLHSRDGEPQSKEIVLEEINQFPELGRNLIGGEGGEDGDGEEEGGAGFMASSQQVVLMNQSRHMCE